MTEKRSDNTWTLIVISIILGAVGALYAERVVTDRLGADRAPADPTASTVAKSQTSSSAPGTR
jgi:hypothetical protein